MSDDNQNSVLLSNFYLGRRRYRVYYHRNLIVWDSEKPPCAQKTVPIENVIAVQHNYETSTHPSEEPRCDPNAFTIHFAERGEKRTWKYNSITFKHSDVLQVSSWVKTLQNHLQKFTGRPKHLLLFVNPYGGKRKALKIFEKFGKPLFQIAGVDVSVIISQRQNQIRDIIINHNLDNYDAVGCVGGDGTISELFNGLVLKECQKQGIDPDDMSIDLPKPNLPIGVIPGGSTDSIAYCLHGTTDVTTAVLHIIFGDKTGLDLVSVYDETRLLRLFASAFSYGYLGDIAYYSEQLRWMGPSRYEYTGFKRIISNTGYKGEIAVLSENDPIGTKCYEKCVRCSLKKAEDNDNKNEGVWKTLKGKFFMVTAANISCACERSPNGIAPYSHLGDGNMHVVLVRHTSLINNLRLLIRLTRSDSNVDDLDFVEIHQAKELCFRAEDMQSRWNCDGEIQHQTDVRAKVRCQLLTVFTRGAPKVEQNEKLGCCSFCKH
ncbi:ceramide kinase [Agrilus planipennis]|uniref:Ceramide kinase n=1 Tax=Agrilus planipennis TaxID=224129 RepID=A0A1W4WKC2_AGRPL|nr:ceramide kinase [Agrilus planipennis]XP_018320578.1 ceramide kinase [Agrilus planipennis]